MFREKSLETIGSLVGGTLTGKITLGASSIRGARLGNLRHHDRLGGSSEELGTLKSSVRGTNAKMGKCWPSPPSRRLRL